MSESSATGARRSSGHEADDINPGPLAGLGIMADGILMSAVIPLDIQQGFASK
jgi:hypothetical protein